MKIALALAAMSLALVLGACGGDEDSGVSAKGREMIVVGYSALGPVYDRLEKAFARTEEGRGTAFYGKLFGPSNRESRAVEDGFESSLVHFSQIGDMERLVSAGLVSDDWDEQPYEGIAQKSIVVIMVPKGNPRNIRSFGDLLDRDIFVMAVDPFLSGLGRWSAMALYGSQLHEGKSEAEALAAVRRLWATNAPILAPSAYIAVQAFAFQGEAEATLAYENEAIMAEKEGADVEYVIPPSTILIETPIAVTEEGPPEAEAFLDYVWSDEGQRIFAQYGHRPVDPELVDPQQFPTPADLFTIDEFGGWGKVNREFFDGQTGKVAKIAKELGHPTGES